MGVAAGAGVCVVAAVGLDVGVVAAVGACAGVVDVVGEGIGRGAGRLLSSTANTFPTIRTRIRISAPTMNHRSRLPDGGRDGG